MPQELAGFLETTPPLYTVVHRVEGASKGTMLIAGPFAEEKKAAQRALVESARAFAQSGYDVLRFDWRGTGDSGGEFAHADVSSWLDDLRAAIKATRQMSDAPLTLLGLRFGAALCWQVASDENSPVENLVLWEPVTNGSSYARQNRQRSQIRAQMTQGAGEKSVVATAASEGGFDFDGFFINDKLQDEMTKLDLQSSSLPKIKRLLLLQISGSPRLKKPFEDLAGRARENGIETEIDNVTLEAFWSSIGLIDTGAARERTLQWLDKSAPSQPFETHKLRVFALSSSLEDMFQPGVPIAERKWDIYDTTEIAPGVSAATFSFQSGNEKVHGVLYVPMKKEIHRCVILLHGWSGYRIGPGQLLSDTARELAKHGFAAYSFDFRGRGESELDVSQASLNTMIRDTARAVAILREQLGWEKFTLLGLCSGGEVAIGASLSDVGIDSLALWSAPIFSGAFDFARQARRSKNALQKYARKLFLPETWSKLLSGSLNWKMIVRALSGGRSNEDAGVEDKAPDTQSQMQAFEAYKGQLLFIYGGNDPETPPSRDFYQEFVGRTQMPHQFHEIEGANHNFYSLEWKRELIELTVEWLKKLNG
jgi:exosortase A-associated hydrolase 2